MCNKIFLQNVITDKPNVRSPGEESQKTLGQMNSSLVPGIQMVSVAKEEKEPENEKSIWGTFHFIAKSDENTATNTHGFRSLSPVRDALKIPPEVLEDIYGGKKEAI